MEIEEKIEADVLVVKPSEERVDALLAEDFKSYLTGAVGRGNHRIVLDLESVRFIDSAGLAAIVSGVKALGGQGQLAISGAGQSVRNLFAMTRLDRVLAVFPTTEEAILSLR